MNTSFKAFRIHQENGRVAARFEQLTLDDLGPGDVLELRTFEPVRAAVDFILHALTSRANRD